MSFALKASQRDVALYTVDLDHARHDQPSLLQSLSPDERARAARFRFERDRRRFVAGRGALREILGEALGRPPSSIAFAYGPQGKPRLAADEIQFNVSHSEGLGLIAVAGDRRVGVDIERVRAKGSGMDVAKRFFSRAEVATLRALPRGLRTEAFFACWTRKEAYIKARG
jgi:4'-phosphopantetheinyl transferase